MTTAELLADLAGRGIRLEAVGDRLRFHPQSAMTPELLDRLKASKGELLALLLPAPALAPLPAPRPSRRNAALAKPGCRCGATATADVPIHEGRSVRRDCARCGRFLDFPVWHGNNALLSET